MSRAALPGTYPIRMTPADLARGERRHCSRCPLALAVARAFPGLAITVSDRPVVIAIGLVAAVMHPTDLRLIGEFVEAYDAGLDPEPIEFDLTIPDPAAESAA